MSTHGLATKKMLRVASAVKSCLLAEISAIPYDIEFKDELYEDVRRIEYISAEAIGLGCIDSIDTQWLRDMGKEWGVL